MGIIEMTVAKIKPIDENRIKSARTRLNMLTKPRGSLGRLEDLASQIAAISGKDNPSLKNKVIFTLAGDHGVTEEGVSAFPKEVTPQMVMNFLNGGAAINALARHVGARVVVADVGVAAIIDSKSKLLKTKKVASGTKNFTKGAAMSREEAMKSIEAGMELVEEEMLQGLDIIGTGDMGIGNTTPSSAIASVYIKRPLEELVGRGTGIDDKGLKQKISAIERGLELNRPDPKDAIDVLSKVGGFEIGGIAGVILAGAANNIPVVIDGFISGAACLIAYALEPKVKGYIIPSHASVEKGHKHILEYIGVEPLMDLNMRLGEGTGASLGIFLAEASVKILNEMATFKSANVSGKS